MKFTAEMEQKTISKRKKKPGASFYMFINILLHKNEAKENIHTRKLVKANIIYNRTIPAEFINSRIMVSRIILFEQLFLK